MKKYFVFFLFAILLLAFALPDIFALSPSVKVVKRPIDSAAVDHIVIRNSNSTGDFEENIHQLLTSEQQRIFVEKWNTARSRGPCKYIARYWIDVYFKDKSKRTFRLNGASIKERNDYCYDIGDDKYGEKLWNEAE
jgi:hypothetical protein